VTEASANQGFIYEFGDFVLDPQEKTLFAKGLPVHLPAKEFETLLLLVENNGHALSKKEMLERVWQDTFVEENNLVKHISLLRKILNSKGQRYIETLSKHGYRFSAEVRQIIQPAEETILEKRTIKRLTVKLEEESDAAPPALLVAKRKFSLIFGIGLGIFVLIAGIWFWNSTTPSTKINSMAVLPLRPLTEGENSKALGLGLTDALITKVGSLRSVAVRPTSAIVKFADADALEG
jgi:DNA-binding winged helix-turn-helix (wHTH) protein